VHGARRHLGAFGIGQAGVEQAEQVDHPVGRQPHRIEVDLQRAHAWHHVDDAGDAAFAQGLVEQFDTQT